MPESVITLLNKKDIAKNLIQLRFSRPSVFSFKAGQFVQFIIPEVDKAVLRSYSISSSPQDEYLEFCVKLLDGGLASAHFKTMKLGESVGIKDPRGIFLISQENTASYFVATGAGLAPIMSMIRDELEHKKNSREIKLLFGVRSEADLFWEDRLKKLAKTHQHFVYDITLSAPEHEKEWIGLRGRVNEHISPSDLKYHFYLCGSADMVRDLRALLIERSIGTENIHFEIF